MQQPEISIHPLIGRLRFNGPYVDYLHDYQHHYERGWPGNKCILPIRCCNPEWYRYDAFTG